MVLVSRLSTVLAISFSFVGSGNAEITHSSLPLGLFDGLKTVNIKMVSDGSVDDRGAIIDTGATIVALPISMERALGLTNGISSMTILADDSFVLTEQFTLKKIIVGDCEVENVVVQLLDIEMPILGWPILDSFEEFSFSQGVIEIVC